MSDLSKTLDAALADTEQRETPFSEKGVGGKLWQTLSTMLDVVPKTAYSTLLGAAGNLQSGSPLAGALEGFQKSFTTGGKEALNYGDYIQRLGLPESAINPYLATFADVASQQLFDPLLYLGGVGVLKTPSLGAKVSSFRKPLLDAFTPVPKPVSSSKPLRAGYESVGGRKPPMPSPGTRLPSGITSDFAPHEAVNMLGLEGGLRRDLTSVGRLTREAAEYPSPSTWEAMLESGFTQPKPGIPMPPSSLRAARGEVTRYSPPSEPLGMTYDRLARSTIEASMRPAHLPPKMLGAGPSEPLRLGGKLFGATRELTSKPIPLGAIPEMRPEAKAIFDRIPIPETAPKKILARPKKVTATPKVETPKKPEPVETSFTTKIRKTAGPEPPAPSTRTPAQINSMALDSLRLAKNKSKAEQRAVLESLKDELRKGTDFNEKVIKAIAAFDKSIRKTKGEVG